MKEDESAKLFNYMQEMRMDLQEQLERKAEKSDTDRIMTALDGIAEIIGRDDVERAAQTSQLNRVEEQTDDHEKRIGRLERRGA